MRAYQSYIKFYPALLCFLLLQLSITPLLANVFDQPALWGRHLAYKQQMQIAMQAKDWTSMEQVCRNGVELLPDDSVWRYNLACALALQGRVKEGIEALKKAVDLGFNDLKLLNEDPDLNKIRALPDFNKILQKAESYKEQDNVAKINLAKPDTNGVVMVSSDNTIWDLEFGIFKTFLAPVESVVNATNLYSGPQSTSVRNWIAEKSAAGNIGDFYDNRDNGHSRLKLDQFPGLTPIDYDAEARKRQVNYGASMFLFNQPVIGNSSVAMTVTWRWRSITRALLSNGRDVANLFTQYLNGQLYCYPSHHDYDPSREGDLYPANMPYVVTTAGSSGSDQPALRAIFGSLAAMRPETKQYLKKNNLLAPTLQMLLRANHVQVTKRDDYLKGIVHRPVLVTSNLQTKAMINMAHELRPETVPPMVVLRTINDENAVTGRDFFDGVNSEGLFDTPCAIARVVRGVSYKRSITVAASPSMLPTGSEIKWHWVVLQGDPVKIKIEELPVPTPHTMAKITVEFHEPFVVEGSENLLSTRVDIGVIADNGHYFSAPAFVSFLYPRNEIRQYSPDNKILSVDYGAAANKYADPYLTLARHWKDVYEYDQEGRLIGWTRWHGAKTERFTADGVLVEKLDKLERPLTARTVQYLPRQTPGDGNPPDLVQVLGDVRVTYQYKNENDRIGKIVDHNRIAP